MEPVIFAVEQGLSLVLGFGGGMAYYRYRLWRIKRHAPSAKVVGFQVSVTQQDYDGLPQKEADVMYAIVPEPEATPDAPE